MKTHLASGIAQVSFPRLMPLCHQLREQVSRNTAQAYNLKGKSYIQQAITFLANERSSQLCTQLVQLRK